MAAPLPTEFRRLAGGSAHRLDELHGVAWASADPIELEYCRLRAAACLGDREALSWRTAEAVAAGLDEAKVAVLDSWSTNGVFSRRERAELAFTEQFLVSVSGIVDDDISALLEDQSPDQVYAFVSAIYVIEMTIRARLAARKALSDEAAAE